MKRVLSVFLLSGFIMLAGYQAYCWYVKLNSFIFFAIPPAVTYALGFSLTCAVCRRLALPTEGDSSIRLNRVDRIFRVGGVMLNLLCLLWLFAQGSSASHYS